MTDQIKGIDLSSWQTTEPPLTGLSFVYARATYDVHPDTMFAKHMEAALKAGLERGAYHFGTGRSPVQAQVDAFLKAAGDVELLVLDLESDGVPMTLPEAKDFIGGVHTAGRRIGLYHSLVGFPFLGQDFNWVADWNPGPPPMPWTFWQTGSRGVDHDLFNGTLDELKALTTGGSVILAATSKPAITTGHVAAGVQLYTLAGTPLVKMTKPPTADYRVVTSVGQSGPNDIVIISTSGVTQYALVRSADFTDRHPVPDPDVVLLQGKIAAAKAALG